MTNPTPAPGVMFFEPINDQVLVQLDVKRRSALELHGKPKVMPSGRVVAIGRGTFVPGTGFVASQVAPGDHVAISLQGEWVNLPLSSDPNEIYVAVSESIILGKLDGVTDDSPWMRAADAEDAQNRILGRR